MEDKIMGKKGTTTAPAISYFDAMRYELEPGRMACQLQADEFTAWLDIAIAKAADPEAIRARLQGSDFLFFADRWHAMLCLIEHDGMTV